MLETGGFALVTALLKEMGGSHNQKQLVTLTVV